VSPPLLADPEQREAYKVTRSWPVRPRVRFAAQLEASSPLTSPRLAIQQARCQKESTEH